MLRRQKHALSQSTTPLRAPYINGLGIYYGLPTFPTSEIPENRRAPDYSSNLCPPKI